MERGVVMSVYVQLALTLSSVNPHRAQSKTSNMTGGVVGASLPYAMQCRDGLRGRIWLEKDTTPARAKAPQRIIIVCIMPPFINFVRPYIQ